MKKFKVASKTFVKSSNSIPKILNNYNLSLIIFIMITIIINLISKNYSFILALLKSTLISLIATIIIEYIINLFTKEKNIKQIFTEDNIIPIALILGLSSIHINKIILIISIFISLLIRKIFKGINLSSVLYGLLIMLIYELLQGELITPLTLIKDLNYHSVYNEILKNNNSITAYLLDSTYYLSGIISIISFIYLFIKKSIKYNLFISYIITFTTIMLIISLNTNMNLWYLFFQLTSGNLLFLSVYCLTDSSITPTIKEGQIPYGIILGMISVLLRIIIPELSIIITLLIGSILLTNPLDRLSIKLKYNHKFSKIAYTVLITLALIESITIGVLL